MVGIVGRSEEGRRQGSCGNSRSTRPTPFIPRGQGLLARLRRRWQGRSHPTTSVSHRAQGYSACTFCTKNPPRKSTESTTSRNTDGDWTGKTAVGRGGAKGNVGHSVPRHDLPYHGAIVPNLRSIRCLIAFDGAAPLLLEFRLGHEMRRCAGTVVYGRITKRAGVWWQDTPEQFDRGVLCAPELRSFIRISMRSFGASSQWHSRIGSSSSAPSGVARADQIATWTSSW